MADVMGELRARGLPATTENVQAMRQLMGSITGGSGEIAPMDGRDRRQLSRMAYFDDQVGAAAQEAQATGQAAPIGSVQASTMPIIPATQLPPETDNVADEITRQVTGAYPERPKTTAPTSKQPAPAAAANADAAEEVAEPVDNAAEEQGEPHSSMSMMDVILGSLGLYGGYRGGKMLMQNMRARRAGEAPDAKTVKAGDEPTDLKKQPAMETPKPAANSYEAGQIKRIAKQNNLTVREVEEAMKVPAARKMLKGLAKAL